MASVKLNEMPFSSTYRGEGSTGTPNPGQGLGGGNYSGGVVRDMFWDFAKEKGVVKKSLHKVEHRYIKKKYAPLVILLNE